MTKNEIIEAIFNTQIECDEHLEVIEYEFGGGAPYTLGVREASVQNRELISKLKLEKEFYEYRERVKA